jgi:hypothetical protein
MEVISRRGVVVVLTDDEADATGRMLGEAIKIGYLARGWAVPPLLAEWRRLLASTAQDRANPQVTAGVGAHDLRDEADMPLSGEPVRLSVKEAACLAKVSEGHMRKLIRDGKVEAIRGRRGAWAVDIPSVSAWIASQRRKERDHKAA